MPFEIASMFSNLFAKAHNVTLSSLLRIGRDLWLGRAAAPSVGRSVAAAAPTGREVAEGNLYAGAAAMVAAVMTVVVAATGSCRK